MIDQRQSVVIVIDDDYNPYFHRKRRRCTVLDHVFLALVAQRFVVFVFCHSPPPTPRIRLLASCPLRALIVLLLLPLLLLH